MKFRCFKSAFIGGLLTVFIMLVGKAEARENILQGSVSFGNNYDSNVFQTHEDRTDEWRTTVSPELSIQSSGSSDSILVEYAPDFSYNHRRDDHEMAQNVTVSGDKSLSPHWQISFSNNYRQFDSPVFEADTSLSLARQFLRADAVTQAEIVRLLFPELVWDPELQLTLVLSELQQRYDAAPALQDQVNGLMAGGGPGARQRYWTDSISLESVYKLAPNSVLTLGYGFEVHDNQTGAQADRTQQSPTLKFSYQFSPQWGLEVGYQYEAIRLDSADDSEAHNPNFRVDFQQAANSRMYFSYDYDAVTYDGTTSDIIDQAAVAGWEYGLDSRTKIDSSLANTYLTSEAGADQRGINLDLGMTRNFESGVFSLTGDCAFIETSSENSWRRLSRSCGMSSAFAYKLSREVTTSFDISYDRRHHWDTNRVQETYDDFQLGADLEYTFLRWFTLQFGYDYHLFDTSSNILDDYNEHLLSIELAAAKELWRW